MKHIFILIVLLLSITSVYSTNNSNNFGTVNIGVINNATLNNTNINDSYEDNIVITGRSTSEEYNETQFVPKTNNKEEYINITPIINEVNETQKQKEKIKNTNIIIILALGFFFICGIIGLILFVISSITNKEPKPNMKEKLNLLPNELEDKYNKIIKEVGTIK